MTPEPSHFLCQFAVFLVVLAVAVASLIYFREMRDGYNLSFAAVALGDISHRQKNSFILATHSGN